MGDVIHLGEAGVGPDKARDLSGYETLELARSGPNRGSVMYVKKYLYEKLVRIYDKEGEEEKKGAEIIQLLISSVPKTSIYGVYLETGKSNKEKAHAHQRLKGRVDDDIRNGYNVLIMGDFNTALNDTKNKKPNLATDLLLEWEESGDIRILNNKEIPTRKPDIASHKANCIDIMAISKGLERKHSNYQLDTEHEWSPATVQTKYNVNLNTEVYLRNKSTDHKAQKVTLHVDLIANGNKGNRAIIDYNNSEGWKKYHDVSDNYALPIIKIIEIYNDKDDLQRAFKKIMHKVDIECFGLKYQKNKQKELINMNRPRHDAVKDLADIIKAQKKEDLTVQEKIKSDKSLNIKMGVVSTLLRGPKHKKRERAAIFDPKTSELLTDENEILSATLQYNIGVLRKTKGEDLSVDTWQAVLKHIKQKNKNMFRHLNKGGDKFKYAMYMFMSHLINNDMVPETYDYTTLFGLWKGKGSKLDLNMTRYIHGKSWDAKLLEALVTERMKPLITKHCPNMQIGGMKGHTSSEHLIVVKTWMKTNQVGETTCIFEAFDMEKFFDKEGLIDTLHTMYTEGKIAESDYRMWFMLNNKTKISVLTPLGETNQATIMNGIGRGSFGAALASSLNIGCGVDNITRGICTARIGEL